VNPFRYILRPHWTGALLLWGTVGCAARHHISGTVIDRNGEPMDRVIVALAPGNVEILTDNEGRFSIDYIRAEDGSRGRLKRRADYSLSFFRTGFQDTRESLYYKRGAYECGTIQMLEDTIEVSEPAAPIDPARLHADPTASGGATYEGE
jgi:hypothetical protein